MRVARREIAVGKWEVRIFLNREEELGDCLIEAPAEEMRGEVDPDRETAGAVF